MSALLRSFLSASRRAWSAGGAAAIVIGNESADADSVISAIAHAYYLHVLGGAAVPPPVPIVSCSRRDFALRREAQWLLTRCIDSGASDLLYLDDLATGLPALQRRAAAGSLQLALVDHNAAWGPAASLGRAVSEIVDHHADSGAHAHVTGSQRCVSFDPAAMRGVGSTCTLVGARLLALHAARAASNAGAAPVLDAPAAEMLVGVILLDTSNMDPTAGKTTPEDERVVTELCQVHDSLRARDAAAIDRSALYAALSLLRHDQAWWATLAPDQALGCDYKTFEVPGATFGIASIGCHVTRFLRCAPAAGDGAAAAAAARSKRRGVCTPHPETLRAVAAFAAARSLDLMVVMSRKHGKRKLALLRVGARGDAATYAALVAALVARAELQLEPVPVEHSEAGGAAEASLLVFRQRNARSSRKQVAPIIADELQAALAVGAAMMAGSTAGCRAACLSPSNAAAQ